MFSILTRRVPVGQTWQLTAATNNHVNPVTTCKWKFLSDAVSLTPGQMNKAWRIKSASISILPKNQTMAGKVTMVNKDPVSYFSTSYNDHDYFIKQLNRIDEPFTDKENVKDPEYQEYHQADRNRLILSDSFDANKPEQHLVSRFKRHIDLVLKEKTKTWMQILTLIPSTPRDVPQSGPVEENAVTILNIQQIGKHRVVQKVQEAEVNPMIIKVKPVGQQQISVRTLFKQPSTGKQMRNHLAGRIFSYIQMKKFCSQVERFKWERPMLGCIKMNTDASLKREVGKKAFKAKGAIIFRDSNAKLVRGCYVILDGSTFEDFDSNLAEMMTIKRGIEKAIELGITWVWVETDNITVSKKINKFKEKTFETEEIDTGRSENEEMGKAAEYEKIAKAIWDLIEVYSIKFQVSHIKGEGNGPADCLASRSFDHEFDFVDPHEISTKFVKKLENDESGVERIRFSGAVNKKKIKKSK